MLMGEIRRARTGSGRPGDVLLPYTLILRESSGPAPDADGP